MKEPPDRNREILKENAAEGSGGRADILNADVRPYRRGTAAANNRHGRSVDHGRGYKAALGFSQDIVQSFRDGPKDQTRKSRDSKFTRFARALE
jgi:hypothetical protein